MEIAEAVGDTVSPKSNAAQGVLEEIIADTGGGGADISIDALGIAETCRNSIEYLALQGQHVQIGMMTREEQGPRPIPVDEMVMNEIEFITSFSMPPVRYDEIFQMVNIGKNDSSLVIMDQVGFADIFDQLNAITSCDTSVIPVVTSF